MKLSDLFLIVYWKHWNRLINALSVIFIISYYFVIESILAFVSNLTILTLLKVMNRYLNSISWEGYELSYNKGEGGSPSMG